MPSVLLQRWQVGAVLLGSLHGVQSPLLSEHFVQRCDDHAGSSIHPHLGAIMPPVLALANQADSQRNAAEAATQCLHKVSAAVGEDGAYLLIAQARGSTLTHARSSSTCMLLGLPTDMGSHN